MGISLVAVLGHCLDAEGVYRLPEQLASSAALAEATRALAAQLAPRWPNLGPSVVAFSPRVSTVGSIRLAWERGENVMIDIGAGASLSIGRRSIQLDHIERFVVFVENFEGLQAPLLRLIRAVARELGAPSVIYMPDSTYPMTALLDLVYDGASFDEIAGRLRHDFGPPAPTLGEIYTERGDSYEVNGYFIDELAVAACNETP